MTLEQAMRERKQMDAYNALLKLENNYRLVDGTNKILVTSDGRVLSFANRFKSGMELTKTISTNPFHKVNTVIVEGVKYNVDFLVAKAFCPNPNEDVFTHILHKDGYIRNDSAKNLVWVTPSEKEAYFKEEVHKKKRKSRTYVEHFGIFATLPDLSYKSRAWTERGYTSIVTWLEG